MSKKASEKEIMLTDISTQIKELGFQLSTKIEAVSTDLENFTVAVAKNFNHMDEKFAKVDERFNQIDEQFKQIDERMDNLEKRVHGTELGINRIEILHYKKLETLEYDILDVRTTMSRLIRNNHLKTT